MNSVREFENSTMISNQVHSPEEMRRSWTSPMYGFFSSDIKLTYIGERPYVNFVCSAPVCKGPGGNRLVRRFLDTQDRTSTGNMRRHAKKCWGEETVNKSESSDVEGVRKGLALKKDGSITSAFEAKGKGIVTYSMAPLTKEEMRQVNIFTNKIIMTEYLDSVETVRWVAESKRPFSIVADRGFQKLMKTGPGRTNMYIPSQWTVSRDTRTLFVATRQRIANLLQVSNVLHYS